MKGSNSVKTPLAPVPPMGWNSWNTFGWNISDGGTFTERYVTQLDSHGCDVFKARSVKV